MQRFVSAVRHADGLLLIAVAITAFFGTVGLASLGLRSDPANFALLHRQLIAIALGLICFAVGARLDWRAWERWWPIVAACTIGALVAVLLVGVRIRGTKGWFAIAGWTLQPVEFAKIALILLQAAYFRRRAHLLHRLRTVLESAAITAAIVIPVLLQPDLGSASMLVATWIGMLLVFGLRRRHALAFAMLAIVAIVVSWQFVLAPYQRDRVLTLLDPNRDPQGAGYNQRQAVIAIGAGGLIGQGFGQGTQAQLRFLPEAQSDFLPAVLGEEFGLLGLGALVATFSTILVRLYHIAERCGDDCSAAMVVGVGILFGLQALYSLAMNLGVAPVTGIPYPFVSAGGSAVLAFAFAFGIVTSIAQRAPRATIESYEVNVIS